MFQRGQLEMVWGNKLESFKFNIYTCTLFRHEVMWNLIGMLSSGFDRCIINASLCTTQLKEMFEG